MRTPVGKAGSGFFEVDAKLVSQRGEPGKHISGFVNLLRSKTDQRSVRVLEYRSHGVLVAFPV